MSSFTLSSPIINGSGSLGFSMMSSLTITSISPVFSFGLVSPSPLALTFPFAFKTYSSLTFAATSCASLLSAGSQTNCISPLTSLKSMKTTPPWSLYVFAQPQSITSLPISALLRSVQ